MNTVETNRVALNGVTVRNINDVTTAVAQVLKSAIINSHGAGRSAVKRIKVTANKGWRMPTNDEHMNGMHASIKIPCVRVHTEAHLVEYDSVTLDL